MTAITLADLTELDRADPLGPMRERFTLPDGIIYLDGNSLGPLPCATAARIAAVVEQEWGRGLIRSWNDAGWMDLPARIADGIARLIGAVPGTVAVCDSTSVNLFKLLGAALRLRPGRRTILTETREFPYRSLRGPGSRALLGTRPPDSDCRIRRDRVVDRR